IMKSPLLIGCLKTCALKWIKENSDDDWKYQVASDKKLLFPYPSFTAALLAYIRAFVRRPIAQILFVLEKLSVTKTFISINQKERNQDLISFLETIFFDPKVLNINDLSEPRPNHYVMSENFYDLKFPFSYYFMKKINEFRTIWENELAILREYPESFDDNQELSHDAFENTIRGFKKKVLYTGKDKVFDPVVLHIYWWKYSNVLLAAVQLTQLCPSVINEFLQKMPGVTFEIFLVDKVIEMMLDKILRKDNAIQLGKWQQEVVKILSLSAKILKTNKLRSYQLLHICYDIVSSKLIQLSNIKEIVNFGLDSDEQN
ncbi:34630_t:CDS:2, partial [Racocetra persica]